MCPTSRTTAGVTSADTKSPAEKPEAMIPVVVLVNSATEACTPMSEPWSPLPMDMSKTAARSGQMVLMA
jgi:hypothetical protein